jgi:ribosome biogenesis protein MAK21
VYEALSSPDLRTSSKHSMFLNLLYRTIKSDVSVQRVSAFLKRLLQVTPL